MAINRDPAEWFDRFDQEIVYGILRTADGWLVLKKDNIHGFARTHVEEVASVDSRQAAIGFIKLLVGN
jgi:hypothetical protein